MAMLSTGVGPKGLPAFLRGVFVKQLNFFGLCLIGSLTLGASAALAAPEISVIRAKGQNAVVRFPKDVVPEKGKKFFISTTQPEAEEMDSEDVASGGGSRDHRISLNLTSALKGGFVFALSGDFGFNMGSVEFGPEVMLARASSVDPDDATQSISTTSFRIGAFTDINFIKNTPAETFVPALGIKAGFSKGNSIDVTGEIALKLFVLGQSSSAIRLAPFFTFTKETGGSTTQFGLNSALSVYF